MKSTVLVPLAFLLAVTVAACGKDAPLKASGPAARTRPALSDAVRVNRPDFGAGFRAPSLPPLSIDLELVDPGHTAYVKYTDISGEFRVTTTGLRMAGTIDCSGDDQCERAGLHGRTVTVDQDLQIVIDVISAGVIAARGRSRGSFSFGPDGQAPVTGDFVGRIDAVRSDRQVDLLVRARVQKGAGLVQTLSGILTRDGWQDLHGVLELFSGPSGTGKT